MFAQSKTVEFLSNQRDAFAFAIEKMDDKLTMSPADHWRHLRMDDSGRISSGHFYEINCFRRICSVLCPGLFRVITEMSGYHRSRSEDRKLIAERTVAASIFNNVLSARFSKLSVKEFQLVLDDHENLVCGFAGESTVSIPNSTIFSMFDSIATDQESPTEFDGGVIGCAGFSVRYRESKFSQTKPLADGGVFRYARGCGLSNSMVGAEAIRMFNYLFDEGGGVLSRLGRIHIRHVGSDVMKRFARGLRIVARRTAVRGSIEKMIADADADSLRLSGSRTDDAPRIQTLTALLRGLGLTLAQAVLLIDDMLHSCQQLTHRETALRVARATRLDLVRASMQRASGYRGVAADRYGLAAAKLLSLKESV